MIVHDFVTTPAVVVGGGIAGLSTALALDACVVVANEPIGGGSSVYAQGGVAAAIGSRRLRRLCTRRTHLRSPPGLRFQKSRHSSPDRPPAASTGSLRSALHSTGAPPGRWRSAAKRDTAVIASSMRAATAAARQS